MRCPQCDGRMECNQTKNFTDPDRDYYYVERRRICTDCGHRMYTVEMPKDVLGEIVGEESDECEG
jgi:transcriptional regulator NrdR family protein